MIGCFIPLFYPFFWENISKENNDDPAAYNYIATQSMSLKLTALQLKDSLEHAMLTDKRARFKLQKLHKALENICRTLDFRIQPVKDDEYIEDILGKISGVTADIDVIKQYQ